MVYKQMLWRKKFYKKSQVQHLAFLFYGDYFIAEVKLYSSLLKSLTAPLSALVASIA